MKITLSSESMTNVATDLLVVGVRSTKSTKEVHYQQLLKSFGGKVLSEYVSQDGFNAKRGKMLKVPARGRVKAKWVLLVGLGSEMTDTEAARYVATCGVRSARGRKTMAIALPNTSDECVRAASEGATSGGYRYLEYKSSDNKTSLRSVALIVDDKKASKLPAEQGRILGECVNIAADLVNAPPNDLNPVTLAEFAQKEAKALGLKCSIWNKNKIKKAGMELFLAVNRGSAIEPRLIHIEYKPKNAKKKICFVGKGLTFDAGGLCLKPSKSMVDMKCDMAGSATTLGIVLAAAKLQLPIEVHAVIGSTENMLGAEAYRPGDVFKSLRGKTVEIINTDAEGRLVLADVLAWAADTLKPDYMIDHATLTGACMVALGARRAALYSNDETLNELYQEAAKKSEEKYWPMPLDKDLRSSLDSSIADLKHTGAPYGGSITAALFLQEFIGDTKWAHLDIAGPAFLDRANGRYPKGGTGFGVATGIRFLEGLCEETEEA